MLLMARAEPLTYLPRHQNRTLTGARSWSRKSPISGLASNPIRTHEIVRSRARRFRSVPLDGRLCARRLEAGAAIKAIAGADWAGAIGFVAQRWSGRGACD